MIMTKEEVEQYIDLNTKFEDRCDYIVGRYLHYFKDEDWEYVGRFKLNGKEVECEGTDRYGDVHWEWFPIEYLTMSQEEIEEALKKRKEEKVKELLAKKKEREKEMEKYELAEYMRLKEKFDNNDKTK